MKRMNLQLFNERVDGKQTVYLYRILSESATQNASILAYVTENGKSISTDTETTATKDGTVVTAGIPVIEITSTSMLPVGSVMIDKLQKAQLEGAVIEIWEANLAEKAGGTNRFKGTYYRGKISSFEKNSPADGYVELSHTFSIDGVGVDGSVTVTAAQQEIAAYEFKDTSKTGA